MLKNDILNDVRITFIFSATLKESRSEWDLVNWGDSKILRSLKKDNWSVWEKNFKNSKEGYFWKENDGLREIYKTKEILLQPLEDCILVEDFFLSKQLFHVGKDYKMISRFIPSIDLKLIFPIKDNDGNLIRIKPTIIMSHYRDVNVVTLSLNFVFNEIGTDDLVYFKSLKWNSIKHHPNSPKIKIILDKRYHGEYFFCDLFKILFEEVFEDKLKIGIESESILDLIEIRDKKIGENLFNRNRDDLLLGILLGDEGYCINNKNMIKNHLSNKEMYMEYRDYFKYFFAPTSILGLFSKEYPFNKKLFAKVYAEKYDNFEPLCKYIDLVSDNANLSDGLGLVGEVTLIRYLILKEIDLKIRNEFEEGKMRFKNLLNLKTEITTRMAKIELLAKDVLWINLLSTSDEMFGYKYIKININERLNYIDNHILYKYNAQIQGRSLLLTRSILLLTLIIVVLTIIMAYIMMQNFLNPSTPLQ